MKNGGKYLAAIEEHRKKTGEVIDELKEKYSALLTEARKQRDEAYKQSQGSAEAISFYKRRGELLSDIIYSMWDSAVDAVNVICYYLRYTHIGVSFSRDQVEKINKAMQGATTIEEREVYGRDLMKLAHALFPKYDDKSE